MRSNGNSGLKAKRYRFSGTKSYHQGTYTSRNFAAMHDHANLEATIGLGEFEAVLNGVQFTTRHNDYGRYMASRTNRSYHAIEKIPYPEVPSEISSKSTMNEQIDEMREWFRAWRDGNRTHRKYETAFKPILCYLEGAWIKTDSGKMEEPFKSERHIIEAKTFKEAHTKHRFSAYAGMKSTRENYAYLPTAIVDIVNGTIQYGQWTYRILCNPLKHYLETNRLYYVDDLDNRMAYNATIAQAVDNRGARFQLNPKSSKVFTNGFYEWELLDEFMYQIPGWDNGKGSLKDTLFGKTSRKFIDKSKYLNAARYHRFFKHPDDDASGKDNRNRGFYDYTAYYAMTSQEKVVGHHLESNCKLINDVHTCKEKYEQKWTYAIPLEIIYLTPLHKWNPCKIPYEADARQCTNCKGGHDKSTAYFKATSKEYYLTPAQFFTGSTSDSDAADTSSKPKGMLTENNDLCVAYGSGVYTELPAITGVGSLRTRFPIAPIHQSGSHVWKQVEALRDLLINEGGAFTKLRKELGL